MDDGCIRLLSASREDVDGVREAIEFEPGLNLIVGRPNTGKTSWLRLIDYTMGSTKDSPEDAIGDVLAQRYRSCTVSVRVAGVEYVLSRRWQEHGGRTRLYVNNRPTTPDEFSRFVLAEIDAPLIRYPKGNPYGGSWTTLSWRTLFRHMYRREDQWTELMPKQPEGEFHACLLEFCGLATAVFPPALAALVEKRRELEGLVSRRDNYVTTLASVTEELLGLNLPEGDLAAGALDQSLTALHAEMNALVVRRRQLLDGDGGTGTFAETEHRSWVDESNELVEVLAAMAGARDRLTELERMKHVLSGQVLTLRRALVSGRTLSPLKTTACPVCDMPVTPREGDTCYLCGGPHPTTPSIEEAAQRIEYELAQLQEELSENDELIEAINHSVRELQAHERVIRASSARGRAAEAASRTSARSDLDAALQQIDMSLGGLSAREQQLINVYNLLTQGESLAEQIASLEQRISVLENEIRDAQSEADFESASDKLSDGMNEYFMRLNAAAGDQLWPFENDSASIDLRKTNASALVEGRNYRSKLGGMLSLYFYIAYHYSLLRTSSMSGFNFPGLLILDFPPDRTAATLGLQLSGTEGFVLRPFLELMSSDPNLQVVATGHGYSGLQAHRVETRHVWV
ncbi:MAG TPA: hypothetical protein VFG89_05225 [Coriobacteriia bacterium]|nr:hypothetical protein [Coriobacteriia bacterium]